ncbi:MAG: acetyl-CoA carboxylase biotin carboxyl carrier protein subunit [Desulfobacteraceae bacterium]|nr:MAG: acetyl-CoA carboxylase biotin carboxyl carrier protein subunit [Desulfobacteraceae bacterium]
MDFSLRTGQTDYNADVSINEDTQAEIMLGGKKYTVDYSVVSDFFINMKVQNGSRAENVNVFVADCSEGKNIVINGRSYIVQDLDSSEGIIQKSRRPDLPDKITPPMPAVVVSIPVSIGDRVDKGQAVIVVSAMKMETTLCAPFDGTVVRINAGINDRVAPGQILVEIEKKEMIENGYPSSALSCER